MRRSVLAITLVSTAMFTTVVVSKAMSQEPPMPPQAFERQSLPRDLEERGRGDPRSFEKDGFDERGNDHRFDLLAMARDLAASEVYLGITPDQLGVWRNYTTALQSLLSRNASQGSTTMAPPIGAPLRSPASEASKDDGKLAGEQLADDIIANAEKARVLKDAVGALKSVLSKDQLQKMAYLEDTLRRHPPSPGAHDMSPPRADRDRPRG